MWSEKLLSTQLPEDVVNLVDATSAKLVKDAKDSCFKVFRCDGVEFTACEKEQAEVTLSPGSVDCFGITIKEILTAAVAALSTETDTKVVMVSTQTLSCKITPTTYVELTRK